jgi:uncharacterized protein
VWAKLIIGIPIDGDLMDIQTILISESPEDDKYIIYRPLAGLAFVGNKAMAELARAIAANSADALANHSDAAKFLESIGFQKPAQHLPGNRSDKFEPTTAVLLMTNQCQLRCTYCYAAAGEMPFKETLTPELGYAAIDYVCNTAMKLQKPQFEVSFHGGGEPTFAWDIMKSCVAYARKKPLPAKITLTSNGVWSPRQREWLIHNLDGLSLSFDGMPQTQDRQRPFVSGIGSAKFVLQTIAALDKHQFPYGIRMTATAPWSSFPEDVRFLCEQTNCRSFQVEPAFNTSRGGHERGSVIDHQHFAAAFMEAFKIATQAGRKLHYAGARIWLITDTFCTAPYNALIVNPQGELVTCYEITGNTHPLAGMSRIGHIKNGELFLDEAARQRLHQLIAERQQNCTGCYCYHSCAGDCYTRTFTNQPGGHLTYGLRCEMNRTITREMLLHQIADTNGVWYRWPIYHDQQQQATALTI